MLLPSFSYIYVAKHAVHAKIVFVSNYTRTIYPVELSTKDVTWLRGEAAFFSLSVEIFFNRKREISYQSPRNHISVLPKS